MKIKTAQTLVVVLIALSYLSIRINTQAARASGTIYIRYDGSIDPPIAPIQRDGNLYTFTADIYDSIQIERPDVTIDGNNFKLQGPGAGSGFTTVLAGRLTIQNTIITGFSYGISSADCRTIKNTVITGNSVGIDAWGSSLNIFNNEITNNGIGISLGEGISLPATNMNVSNNILTGNNLALDLESAARSTFANNTITKNYQSIFGNVLRNSKITRNNLSDNTGFAIELWSSFNNIISNNVIKYNNVGLNLTEVAPDGPSTNNTLAGNIFAYNNVGVWMGYRLEATYGNYFYHNNFIDNAQQVYSPSANHWDNGYPSGGNFWTGYTGDDIYSGPYQNLTGSDGIGDTPYIIDENDRDNYPFMTSNTTTFFTLNINAATGGTTNPPPGAYIYIPNTVVSVTALPDAQHLFDYWNLDNVNVGSANPVSLTMNGGHVLQAVFKARPDFVTIYIRQDGSIDPPTSPIQRLGDVYLFTADIYGSITITCGNIVVDGNGYRLEGAGSGMGFFVDTGINVTLVGVTVTGFGDGINVFMSSLVNVKRSITSYSQNGIVIVDSSSCSIRDNVLSHNANSAILLYSQVDTSLLDGNSIEYNHIGIEATASYIIQDNTIAENTIAHNDIGVRFDSSGGGCVFDNLIYHNNFIENTQQASIIPLLPGVYPPNNWDNGYPSGGNFWSDHSGDDIYGGPSQDVPGSDGICDAPYVIDVDIQDGYPLMNPSSSPSPPMYTLTIIVSVGGTTNPSAGTYQYSQGQTVPVEATPDSGYYLVYWELDGNDVGNSLTFSVVMNAPHILNPVFEPYGAAPEFPLGLALEIALIPIIIYLSWKRKYKIPQ